jgi:hypothetical protein
MIVTMLALQEALAWSQSGGVLDTNSQHHVQTILQSLNVSHSGLPKFTLFACLSAYQESAFNLVSRYRRCHLYSKKITHVLNLSAVMLTGGGRGWGESLLDEV